MAMYDGDAVRTALENAQNVIGHLITVLKDTDYDWGGPDNEVANWLISIEAADRVIEYALDMTD